MYVVVVVRSGGLRVAFSPLGGRGSAHVVSCYTLTLDT